jgi:protein SCO1/2
MKTKLLLIASFAAAWAGPGGGESRAEGACCAASPAEAVAEVKARPALPDASLYQAEVAFVTDAGAPFRLEELRGRPVALAMFFAQCRYACPATVLDLTRIREKLPEAQRAETRIVMVSFDTERDTPEALRAFRESRGLPADWVLLHGGDDAVRELAALLGVKFKRETDGNFAHSNLITILSKDGEMVHRRAGLSGGLDEAAAALAVAATASEEK